METYSEALTGEASKKKQYYGVDLCKFIGALLVVMIHTQVLSSYDPWVNHLVVQYIARLAVPFFFVASGYFLFRKTSYENFDKKIPLSYAGRILRLYVIWTVIYFPLSLKETILCDKGILHGLLSWGRNVVFAGSYIHLWYLNATIVATLILTFCLCRKMKLKTILITAAVFYAIGMLPETYFVLLRPLQNVPVIWTGLKLAQKVIVHTYNGLFDGFLFMGIGMAFAYKPIVIKFKTAVWGFIGSMLLLLVESIAAKYFGWARDYNMYIFLVPSVFFLFYLATHVELKENKIYKYLRELGILIFYLHMLVKFFVSRGCSILGTDNSLLVCCGTILVSALLAQFILFLSRHEKFQWLKVIYT